jgi:hypothetical protein
MKTFYSILSVIINSVSGEKISIGLLLSDGNRSLFAFSENRLSLLSSLVDKETKKFVRQYLKSIESIIKKIDVNQDQLTILEETGKNLIINEPYISYLSIYNQNVISFSKPVSIDVKIEEKIFSKLFSRFIDDDTNVKTHIKSNIQLIKTNFYPRVKDYFSFEKELTPENHKRLILPVSIDLLGKNDNFVIGQFFDLEKNIYHIKTDYFDYNQVSGIIKTGRKFVISSEPDKIKYPHQHNFWKEIQNQKKHTFIDISELEIIEEYAKIHQVKPVE